MEAKKIVDIFVIVKVVAFHKLGPNSVESMSKLEIFKLFL